MSSTPYNVWGAVLVEICRLLINQRPALAQNKWLAMVANYWMEDWLAWKTAKTLQDVDQQASAIVREWEAQEPPAAIYSEEEPDGSDAQALLGGEMRIRGRWVDP